jgi:hypothetical protein
MQPIKVAASRASLFMVYMVSAVKCRVRAAKRKIKAHLMAELEIKPWLTNI